MDFNKKILVFPCGSEVALEIYRSLEHSIHFTLFGASSVDDHGKFVYKNYIGGLPFLNDENFIEKLKHVINTYQIDAIYPATDSTIQHLKINEEELGCKVISSIAETTDICLSKSKTYQKLKNIIPTPIVYNDIESIQTYPVFLKPDVGYGSRGVKKAENKADVIQHLSKNSSNLILEYLPGKEYTVDCFTDQHGQLLFSGPRERKRISNGISVNTSTMPSNTQFDSIAHKINNAIKFSGAWFVQLKERADGSLVLMEIASRLAGSSGVYRIKGVNFAALSLYTAFDINVEIIDNDYTVEVDRALTSSYKVDIDFDHAYIDFDDTLIVNEKVNLQMVYTIYHFINTGKKIYLITKHKGDIFESLKKHRLSNLFDEIIHIKKEDQKWKYIKHDKAIYIDDSFIERKHIKEKLNIPVFNTDMIESFWQID